jgi:hypothetical protein
LRDLDLARTIHEDAGSRIQNAAGWSRTMVAHAYPPAGNRRRPWGAVLLTLLLGGAAHLHDGLLRRATLFYLGDNRDLSRDSRFADEPFVPRRRILGRVRTVLASEDPHTGEPRWDRFGAIVR